MNPDPTLASILVIAVFVLAIGGIRTIVKRPEDRKRGILMLVCALVLLGNVLIWTI
jgi:hypothetical protein